MTKLDYKLVFLALGVILTLSVFSIAAAGAGMYFLIQEREGVKSESLVIESSNNPTSISKTEFEIPIDPLSEEIFSAAPEPEEGLIGEIDDEALAEEMQNPESTVVENTNEEEGEMKLPKPEVEWQDGNGLEIWDDSVGFKVNVANSGDTSGVIEISSYTKEGSELKTTPKSVFLPPGSAEKVFIEVRSANFARENPAITIKATSRGMIDLLSIPVIRQRGSYVKNVDSGVEGGCGIFALN